MRASKIDANQPEIVSALRKVGAVVHSTAGVAKGFPDLTVGYRRVTYLLEVKDGSKPPSERKLTPDQQKWHADWFGGPCVVVNNVQEALAAIGAA